MLRPRSDSVLHLRRHLGIDLAGDQPVLLQLAQLVGQHARGDARQQAADLVEAQRPGQEVTEDHDFHLPSMRPIAASTAQPGVQSKRKWPGLGHHGILFDSMSDFCAYCDAGEHRRTSLPSQRATGGPSMNAVGYQTPRPIDRPTRSSTSSCRGPSAGGRDLLVEVAAVSVNPVDTKVRAARSPSQGEWKVLGWDAAGTVVEVGPEASRLQAGRRGLLRRRHHPPGHQRRVPPGRRAHRRPQARIACSTPRPRPCR